METMENSVAALVDAGFPSAAALRALRSVPACGSGGATRVELAAEKLLAEGQTSMASKMPMTEESVEEPSDLLCPVLHTMYRDPVFNAAGNTYERAALEMYMSASRGRVLDPLTNECLPDATLITNWDMRRRVQAFLDAHPRYVPEGWTDRTVPPPRATSQVAMQRSSFFEMGLPLGILVSVLIVIAVCWVANASNTSHDWIHDGIRMAKMLPRFVLILGLFAAILLACHCVTSSMGWSRARGTKRFVHSLTKFLGVICFLFAAGEIVFPGFVPTPMVIASMTFSSVACGLGAKGWQSRSGLRKVLMLLIMGNAVAFCGLGWVEWKHGHPGLFANVVSLASVEVSVGCVVAIPWLVD